MATKSSPVAAPALVRARLAYLRRRKAVVNDLIQSLERYAALETRPAGLGIVGKNSEDGANRLAGAA